MSTTPTIYIEGLAFWSLTRSAGRPRAAYRGESVLASPPTLVLEGETTAIHGSGY